jgi:hypothetical protein
MKDEDDATTSEDSDEEGAGALEEIKKNSFGREKKAKIAVKVHEDKNIFLKFKGFTPEAPFVVSPTDHMYVVDTTAINAKIRNSPKYNFISVNISGGVVAPNPEPVFHTHASDLPTGEPVMITTGDFESLYPKTMIFGNICPSVANYNPRYASQINGKLYNPFNPDKLNILAAPIKINDSYFAAFVAVADPRVKKSVAATLIEDVIKRRKEMKVFIILYCHACLSPLLAYNISIGSKSVGFGIRRLYHGRHVRLFATRAQVAHQYNVRNILEEWLCDLSSVLGLVDYTSWSHATCAFLVLVVSLH